MYINTEQKNIYKHPYKHYFFWENKISKDTDLWEGYFENENITKDSKIVYTGILDYEKNILHYGFVMYPSVYKLLGFLQHIFLPTSFFTWFDRKSFNFYIPMAPYSNVVQEVVNCDNNIDLNLVDSMNKSYSFIKDLWGCEESLIGGQLKYFCEKFNSQWDKNDTQKLFLRIFDSPSDIFDFVKDSIGWSNYSEFIEEEISMSLDTLKFTCDNAIVEPLLNKNFIDILNKDMPVLF